MPGAPEFPIFTKVEHRPNSAAAASFSAEVDKLLDAPRRKINEFSEGARKALDTALSLPRSQTGSLDLGIPQLREAVTVQQARATAAREVANATLEAARASGTFTQQTRLEISAAKALATEEERAALALRARANAADQVQAVLNRQASATTTVIDATRRGTEANHLATGSAKSLRFASIQAGQQVQDLAISLYSGQRASVVFAQQIPQLAFVLTGLEGSTNRTAATIGRFASFLSRPSGFLVIGAASLALGFLIEKFLSAGDAADKTKKATLDLTEALTKNKVATDEGRKAIDDYNDAQQQQRNNADAMIKLNLALAETAYAAATATRQQLAAELARADELVKLGPAFADKGIGSPITVGLQEKDRIRDAIGANNADLARLAGLSSELRIKDAQRDAEAAADPIKKINDYYEDMAVFATAAAKSNLALERSLKGVLTQIEKQKAAALDAQRASDKKTRDPRDPRDPGELSTFISPVTGGRITSGFGAQRGNTRHPGLDIGVPVGTPVKAPAGGVVIEAGTLGGYGNVVFIDHGGGTITRLAHLSKIGTAVGQSVAQGEIVGLSGGARGAAGSGNSTGPHLHQETRVGGRAVNPLTGRFPTDGLDVADRAQEALEKSAEAAAKAREQLEQFGERSAESIARVNERFNEQPRLIDQAAQATRQLDKTISDLESNADKDGNLPIGFQQMIDDAKAAKAVIQDALVRPFEELAQESERRIGINKLVAQGREDEADALQTIWQFEKNLYPLTQERKEAVFAIAAAERAASEELERQQEKVGAYLDATRSIRSEIEALLSGDKPNFKRIFKQLQGKILFEQLFGDTFRKLEKSILRESGIEQSVDKLAKDTTRAGDTVLAFADTVNEAIRRIAGGAGSSSRDGLGPIFDGVVSGIGGAANDNATRGIAAGIGLFGAAVGRAKGGTTGNEIVVTAIRLPKNSVAGMTPDEFRNLQLQAFSKSVVGKALDSIAGGLSGVVGAGLSGYAAGGIPGAAVGAVQKLFEGSKSGIGKALGSIPVPEIQAALALNGAVNDLLGNDQIKNGGTLGLFSPVLTALFGKALKGSASISGEGGAFSTTLTGNSKSRKKASGQGADSVIATIESLAEQLGGILDTSAGSVSIGVRKKKNVVDPTGRGRTKGAGVLGFGEDGEAAVRAATLDLLKDGVISGLRAGTQQLLQNAKTIEQGLAKAVNFQSVFDRLKARTDPVGSALDGLDREFSRLKSIFVEAGASTAEYADLEKLYGLERADTIKQAFESIGGSLRGLLTDLTINNDALSLRDRKGFAQVRFDPLAARVKAGDVTAFDDFSEAARALLEIERQISGSQGGYFALLGEVKGISQTALDATTALADAANGRDSPFSKSSAGRIADNQLVVDSVDNLGFKLDAVNDNLGTLIQMGLLNRNGAALAGRGDF